MDAATLAEGLASFLTRRLGVGEVSVTSLRRMAGGASREIWSLDVDYAGDSGERHLELALRRARPGMGAGIRVVDEAKLLDAAAAAGVPVPKVHWVLEGSESPIGDAFLMDRIAGETLPRRLLRDEEYASARTLLVGQLAESLARLHAIDCRGEEFRFLAAPEPDQSPAILELDRYEQIYRYAAPEPHPAIELAFRWLRRRAPRRGRVTLVHGDYRVGNVLCGPEGLRAVLDWELAHIGDPMEDLGWLCVRAWRFGNDAHAVGGLGERASLFAAYEAAGGCRVDPSLVEYWEILGNLKWAVITILQAKTYLDGHTPSVELASLGRRTAEVELELLDKIEATK